MVDLQKKFNSFGYAKHLYTDGCIILIDEPMEKEAQEELKSLAAKDGRSLIVIGTKQLAAELEKFLQEIVHKENDVLFVFPGNGSNYPKALSIICQRVPGTGVYAKRIWKPGENPFAVAGSILPEVFLHLQIATIVVVDDVISSGKTMNKLYQNNEWRFPRAKWIGAAWLSQVPTMKADSGVNGYKRVVAACVVEGPNERKVPINSLSTLRNEPNIAQDYAKRHFSDADAFLRIIS